MKTKQKGPLRKDLFHSLLRQTLKKVEVTSADNIRAGFQTTGKVPLDRGVVLKKIPNQDTEARANKWATDIVDTIKDLFQTARFGTKEDNARPAAKKKKLDVPAGQSVSFLDTQKPSISSESLPVKPKPKRKVR